MNFSSLRSRYALIATLTGLLILATTFFADYLLTDSRKEAALNIEQRQRLLQRNRHIRNAVWQAREAISHFLLDPQRQANREQLFHTINEGLSNTERLLRYPWLDDAEVRNDIERLRGHWLALHNHFDNLVEIRVDTNEQFPGFAVALREMMPRQQAVYDQFEYALNENKDVSASQQRQVYDQLIEARHRWSMIITAARMYIASRVGSFAADSMPALEKDIHLYYKDFRTQMQQLEQRSQQGELGFNTEMAVDIIQREGHQWYTGFKKLVEIHRSDAWRQDLSYLQKNIEPLLEDIWMLLLQFDSRIERGAEQDVAQLGEVAETQSRTIWLFSLLGLVFVIVMFLSFQRAVLKPLSKLVEAFDAIAHGDHDTPVPQAHSSEMQQLLAAFSEMHRQVQQRQHALEYQTLHDDLTGLANRNLLLDRLAQHVTTAKRHGHCVCVMMVDLDRFKEVNDSLGHQVGDQLLIQVSNRLNRILRDEDTVARLGGDEFALLFSETDSLKADIIARKLIKIFERAFHIAGHELYVHASVGIAIYPKDGMDVHTLLKHADVAMYHAKRYRLSFSFYDAYNSEQNTDSLTLGNELRNALSTDALSLHFQPIYDLKTREPTALEALLRWEHPQHGHLPVTAVISLAEQIGLINQLTLWVLENALRQHTMLRDAGHEIAVHVNLSAHNFESDTLVTTIETLLRRYDISPHFLNIEITESAMMADLPRTVEALKRLDEMGVEISVDDYGTGFSSLNYLKQLPVDMLKIDKSFVMHMFENENDAVIVRSTIDLAHNLGLKVVAEGVETQDVWDLLSILGCDFAQGFHMSRPVPGARIADALRQWPHASAAPVLVNLREGG